MLAVSEYELVTNCLKGDQDSFAELVRRYRNLVFSTVTYYIKDAEEANDMSQEVFLRIYRALKSYNPKFKFSTWSVIITKNLCLDYVRKKKLPQEPIDDYENVCRDDDTPEDKYIRKERNVQLRRFIEMLPEKYRLPVVLYHQKGLSYKEIAVKLDEPLSIIKNRIYRARLSIRDSLLKAGAV